MRSLFGVSQDSLLIGLLVATVVVAIVLAMAGWRNPLLLRLAWRNVPRRPGVAVLITPDAGKNEIQDVRIGLGAVAPTPIRALKTEALLRGKPLGSVLLKEAALLAASEASPISDQRSSAENRRWIVEALTRRGLQQTWKAATGKEVA